MRGAVQEEFQGQILQNFFDIAVEVVPTYIMHGDCSIPTT